RRPVLLFENVKGSKFPVLTNLHASRPRLAAAMNTAPEATQATYLRAMERPLAPKIVPSGPVHEVVLEGNQVNLYDLPQIVHHEGDAGAYVTAAISFAKDPTRERTPEGPFGEFTGYSLGERQREIVHVKAITHRRDAIFQDITVAHLDHMLLSTIPMEANLFRAVRAMVPSVKAVRVPGPFT